jgi:integrase
MARKRRGRGEGSISQRPDGLWHARISLGYDRNGHRKRRHIYGKTKQEVQAKLRKLQAEVDGGTLMEPSRQTVADFLARWLEEVARPTIRPTSYLSYEGVIRLHIGQHLGGIGLGKLTPPQVQGLYAAMEKAGASPRLRQLTHAVLPRALKQAVRWNLIPRNPCDAVEPPRVGRKEMKAYTPEQVQQLLKAAEGHRLEALFLLAVTGGLRQGELFGLHWPDIDLEGDSVSVQRTLEELRGRFRLAEPKSAKIRRQVQLPRVAVGALRRHRARMEAEGRLEGPVFCDTHGGWLRKSNFLRQVFKPLLRRAGLPEVRFHDLRHTHATLLLAQGVHPKVVQERLGHSQISLTMDTYSQVLPTIQKEAAAKLDGLFGTDERAGRRLGVEWA